MRITLEEAKKKMQFSLRSPGTEKVNLRDASQRILAEDITATLSQPPFRRSSMDGYAVFEKEIEMGRAYPVLAEIDAGDTKVYHVEAPYVVRIMTGAPCPEGAVMVIPQEMSDYGKESVSFHELPRRDNIVPVGEDFHEGDVLVEEGTLINANVISCISAIGVGEVLVYKNPRVAILSTGNELVERGKPLRFGQIYDTNLPYLAERVKELHGEVVMERYLRDDLTLIADTIREAVGCADYVITTGGVSVGNCDLLEEAVQCLDGTIMFHGIDVKPGMPTMYSLVEETPVLSLSGNPFAARCLFELLNPFRTPVVTKAKLQEAVRAGRPVRRFVPAVWDGEYVQLSDNRKNGNTKSSVGTNCLAELPQGDEEIEAGELVTMHLPV